jgi:inner membrane protein
MTPGAHLLASWLTAYGTGANPRERRIISLVGIAPDLDGFGWLIDKVNNLFGNQSFWYEEFHHILGHNLVASFVMAWLAARLSGGRRVYVFVLSLVVFHLHIACDVLGSRGPDGYQWPIYYLMPFDSKFGLVLSWQWELNSWQNSVIIVGMLTVVGIIGWRKRCSFVEVISAKLEHAFFEMLNRRWPRS